MKQILLIFMLFSFSCKSQEYPLNTSLDNLPNNAYLKDTNNDLNKYIGLWRGNWNGKTLFLDLRKVKYHYIGNQSYYEDKIFGERKVIGANGSVEIDRIANFDFESPEFRGIGTSLKNGNWKRLYFNLKNMCGKKATLDIISFTDNQMTLHFEYLPSITDPNCQHNAYVDQYGDFPINFPKDITLTKQ